MTVLKEKKSVLVGLSGKVSSLVTAFLLKKQGLRVVGVTIVSATKDLTHHQDELPRCSVDSVDKIAQACDRLGIEFYATNAQDCYETQVLDPLIANKLTGKANATCFNCHRMRMHILWNKMQQLKLDSFATGHYAKVSKNLGLDSYHIHSHPELASDQSFLLAGVRKEVLKDLVLPLSELKQSEVFKIAKTFNLTEGKLEAGGHKFCFMKKGSTAKLMEERVAPSMIRKGQIIEVGLGKVLADHEGVMNYYITQKDFLTEEGHHPDSDLEVVAYDYPTAVLYVGKSEELTYSGVSAYQTDFSTSLNTSKPLSCFVKLKISQEFLAVQIFFKNNHTAFLQFPNPIYPIISDETLVFYDRDTRNAKIIGHAKIFRPGEFRLVDRVEIFRREEEGEDAEENASVKTFKKLENYQRF